MTSTLRLAFGAAVTMLVTGIMACGGGMPRMPAAPSPTVSVVNDVSDVSVAGTWDGTSTDSQGVTVVNWALVQNGSSVSGTVTTRAPNPSDGSCNSCHRNKRGTFSGTIAGSTLTLTMIFAAGLDGDPTPICSATLSGLAAGIATDKVTAEYTGSDTCEGPFLNGSLAMTRSR